MSSLPQISIVTPSFNQAEFLEEAILSVLEQGYANLEYIIMDGGSTDGSVDIIKRYAQRLTHWESAPDGGQTDAISRGFHGATGEILGWLNSDDLLLRGCLQKVGQFFADRANRSCVVGGCVHIGPGGELLRDSAGIPVCNLGSRLSYSKLLFWQCGCVNQPATFWRREALWKVGGLDTRLQFCMDYDLYIRLARLGSFGRIRDYLACFRLHPASKTSTIPETMTRENRLLWERYGRYKPPRIAQTLLFQWYDKTSRIGCWLFRQRLRLGLVPAPAALQPVSLREQSRRAR